MNLRDLEYQTDVLKAVDAHIRALREAKAKSDKQAKLADENPDAGIVVSDFTAKAWEDTPTPMRHAPDKKGTPGEPIPFSPRTDGTSAPVPNATLKVPTGGGKTFLAVHSVGRIMEGWVGRRTGFVLWIVPNEAIYTQTLKALRTRSHPYRQRLDQTSNNRTLILEKGDPLHAKDVEGSLCVMLLMLQ